MNITFKTRFELFPTYHQHQDVETGIKQDKGTFSFTKLPVRSPAGIRLLGQCALIFWPNFVRWTAEWLSVQVLKAKDRFKQVLPQARTQVRVAASARFCRKTFQRKLERND